MNELPEVVKSEDCPNINHNNDDNLFGDNCYQCGIAPCYADDCTVLVTSRNQVDNKIKLNDKLGKLTEFIQSNLLCINQGKTKTQNFMVHQKRTRVENDLNMLIINTRDGQKVIKNEKFTRILGLNLQEDITWRGQLETGQKPLLPSLRKRLGSMRHIGRQIPRRGRLILANGLIVAKIIYMIQVWGGTNRTHLKKVQKIFEYSSQICHHGGKRWRSLKLMKECGWFTIYELEEFHTLILLWKILNFGKPKVLTEKFTWIEDKKIEAREPRLQLNHQNYLSRGVRYWNNLSIDLRYTGTISSFKNNLKKEIISRRPDN